MPAETVTLDRSAIIELLTEAHAVADVLERIAGVSPVNITEELVECAERIAEEVLGEVPPDLDQGPRFDLWMAGKKRARVLLREYADGG